MTPGFDARISKYGIEIHTANPLDFKNTITTCGIDKNFETNEPVKEDVGNGYNITCSSNLPRDAEAFSEIKKAIENNNTIKVFGFIEYKTNEITGTNFSGTEHVVLKRITTDKLGVGTGSGKQSEEGKTTFDITLNNPAVNKLEFSNCKSGTNGVNKVTAVSNIVNGYTKCNIAIGSDNDNIDPVNFEIPGLPGNIKNTKEFTIAENKLDKPTTYKITLSCNGHSTLPKFEDTKQFIVPVCAKDSGKDPSIEDQCKATKDSEGEPMCQPVFGIGSQVTLNYKGSKITTDNITAITDLDFNVKLTGSKCTEDLLKRFKTTKANIKVDGIVIKTLEIPHNTREASFNFKDIFYKLPPNTQENIVNTFGKEHPDNGSPIQAAAVNFYFETWDIFDNDIKDSDAAENFNCN
ncbi:MAG: hypothetical protein WC422_03165 [Candidatus Paceibacterota bacterium]|jgi:hypothetical protein